MVERWGLDFPKRYNCLITGDSAGTIFAVCVALGRTPDQLDDLYRHMSNTSHENGVIGKCAQFMEDCLRELFIEYPEAYKVLQGKCMFGTTSFPFTHRWHTEWESNEHLIESMRNSFHVPIYCNSIPRLYGAEYTVDGAYSFKGSDLPHANSTLYVGIDPHAEVTRLFTNSQMFYPAIGDAYDEIVRTGYDAMLQWNGKFNVKVGSRRPNYEALHVLWFLKVIEVLIDAVWHWFLRHVIPATPKPAPLSYKCAVKGSSTVTEFAALAATDETAAPDRGGTTVLSVEEVAVSIIATKLLKEKQQEEHHLSPVNKDEQREESDREEGDSNIRYAATSATTRRQTVAAQQTVPQAVQ